MGDVKITYESMRAKAKRLKSEKMTIEDKLNDLKREVDELVSDGYVTGRSSKKFHESFEEFTKGAKQTIEGLEGMGEFLKSAADAFENLDTELEKGLSK